ncbi:MAG TPA: ABC transporter ATP-binding protein [Acidimicrobiia bacterium]|nr:ABC transporter ATP-binding protein [Acidimicrobiia bacterium]
MLAVAGLEVVYGGRPVLAGVNLDVADGEAVAVLGPNGAGKTTLARAITGVVRPSNGTITFDGRRLDRLSPRAIVRAGVTGVPAGRRIFAGLTVLDNLRVGASTRGRQADADVDWAFGLFPGLRTQAYRPAGALPAGEQQVLALARALVSRPKLLLVDELSAGVSPALAVQLFDVLRGLSLAGVSLLVIDQFVNLALGLADRAVVVENGGVSVCSEPARLAPADVSWQSTHPGGGPTSAKRTKGAPG